MSVWNRPELSDIINNDFLRFEETTHRKLTNENKELFILGIYAGMTFLNKAPESPKENLERFIGVNLNENDNFIFKAGVASGLITLKYFPEYIVYYVEELLIKIQLSKMLNKEIKLWAENLLNIK